MPGCRGTIRRAASTLSPSCGGSSTWFASRSRPRSDPCRHREHAMKLSYRDRVKLLGGAGVGLGLRAAGLATLAGWVGSAEAEGDTVGTLRWVLVPEPPMLVTAFSSAQMVQQISAKMMDG